MLVKKKPKQVAKNFSARNARSQTKIPTPASKPTMLIARP